MHAANIEVFFYKMIILFIILNKRLRNVSFIE